ncbi:hypothetical protein IKO70_05510 [bacterium]|nr:hypothetical protein [bacterium]
MKKILMLMIVFSMFMTVACSPKMIKGTNIEETPDSKEILTVFGYYIKGFKEQNPEIFLEYVSKDYYDTNGTDEAADDIDYDKLIEILNSDAYHSLEKVSITCIIKDLFFINDAGDKAELVYFYEVRFKMKSSIPPMEENAFIQPDGMTNQKVMENNKMKFVKEDGKWKIVSGL